MRPVAAETSVRYRSELRITAHREVRMVLRSFSVLWKTRKRAYPLTITGAPERSSVLTVTSTTKPFPVGRPFGVTTCFSSRIPKFVSGWNLSPFQ